MSIGGTSFGAVTFFLQDSGSDIDVTVTGTLDLSILTKSDNPSYDFGPPAFWWDVTSRYQELGTASGPGVAYLFDARTFPLPDDHITEYVVSPGFRTGAALLVDGNTVGEDSAFYLPLGSSGVYDASGTYTLPGVNLADLGWVGLNNHLFIDPAGDSNDVFVNTVGAGPIPEPSRALLSLVALGAVAARRRRR